MSNADDPCVIGAAVTGLNAKYPSSSGASRPGPPDWSAGKIAATWHTHTSRQSAYMLSLPNGPIPRSTQGHRQSAGFPSRRKPQAPGPPTRRPFLSRQCPPRSGGLHAFVMFMPRSWPVSSRIIFVCEPVIPCHARPAAGRRLEGSRGKPPPIHPGSGPPKTVEVRVLSTAPVGNAMREMVAVRSAPGSRP